VNKQETAEAILVMQGYADGGIVEEKDRDPDGVQGWHEYGELHAPLFNFELYEYRIKPSPREFWIWTSKDGDCLWRETYGPQDTDRDAIKVREVLE